MCLLNRTRHQCVNLCLPPCSCAGYVDDGEVTSPKVQGLSSPSAESVCVSCEGVFKRLMEKIFKLIKQVQT